MSLWFDVYNRVVPLVSFLLPGGGVVAVCRFEGVFRGELLSLIWLATGLRLPLKDARIWATSWLWALDMRRTLGWWLATAPRRTVDDRTPIPLTGAAARFTADVSALPGTLLDEGGGLKYDSGCLPADSGYWIVVGTSQWGGKWISFQFGSKIVGTQRGSRWYTTYLINSK